MRNTELRNAREIATKHAFSYTTYIPAHSCGDKYNYIIKTVNELLAQLSPEIPYPLSEFVSQHSECICVSCMCLLGFCSFPVTSLFLHIERPLQIAISYPSNTSLQKYMILTNQDCIN